MIRCSKCHINYTTDLICTPCLDDVDEQNQANIQIISGNAEIMRLKIRIRALKHAIRNYLHVQSVGNEKNLLDLVQQDDKEK